MRKITLGVLIVASVTIVMAIYAAHLNELFYSRFSPFYDSNGYLLSLLNVLDLVQDEGLINALLYATKASGPTTLPFIEVAFLSPFMQQPSRTLAPFIQLPWLTTFTVSLFLYFHLARKKNVLASIALSLPFISISALWNYNGGLSDFRMDLLLYLLLGTTFVYFLWSRHSSSYFPWFFTGLFLGLTCLARVTAPIYAFICLAPPIFLRLLVGKSFRLRTLLGTLIIAATSILVSGWFYIINFEAFYHYYFIWNTDANAKLPIVESIKHLNLTIANIGPYAISMTMIFFFFGLITNYWFSREHRSNPLQRIVNQFEWESLWLGIAPTLFLVLRGAGLNPFVSMPAAFGLLMFFLSPFLINPLAGNSREKRASILEGNASEKFLCAAVILTFLLSMSRGIENHLRPFQGNLFQNMLPQRALVETVAKDSEGIDKVLMASTYISQLNDTSLENILRFDYPDLSGRVSPPPLSSPPKTFNRIQSASDWEDTPGNNDDQKIDYLVAQANQTLHYIILPNDESINSISQKNVYVIVNQHIGQIKKQLLLTGEWTPIGQLQQVDHDETVQVYRNKKIVP